MQISKINVQTNSIPPREYNQRPKVSFGNFSSEVLKEAESAIQDMSARNKLFRTVEYLKEHKLNIYKQNGSLIISNGERASILNRLLESPSEYDISDLLNQADKVAKQYDDILENTNFKDQSKLLKKLSEINTEREKFAEKFKQKLLSVVSPKSQQKYFMSEYFTPFAELSEQRNELETLRDLLKNNKIKQIEEYKTKKIKELLPYSTDKHGLI